MHLMQALPGLAAWQFSQMGTSMTDRSLLLSLVGCCPLVDNGMNHCRANAIRRAEQAWVCKGQ